MNVRVTNPHIGLCDQVVMLQNNGLNAAAVFYLNCREP